MTRILRCGSLIGGLMLALACGTEQPNVPTVPALPADSQPQRKLPVGDPVGTFAFSGPLNYAVRGFTEGSQYVLYGDGAFGLRFAAFPHVYLGTYRHDSSTISFRFDGSWTGGQGIATGALKGDLLEIRYSEIMEHSDFENAVYRRSP